MSKLWMICYDISDHKIRRNVSKTLLNYGTRVQYSIFECRLDSTQFIELRESLIELIEAHDKLRWYPLCTYCETEIYRQGISKPTDTNEYYLV